MNTKVITLIFFISFFQTSLFCQKSNQIIEYQTIVTLEKGRLITEKSFLIQINDKPSDWIANIGIPFDSNQKFEVLEATIINSKGVIVRSLKEKDFLTRSRFSQSSFFEDRLIKEFSLKWNEYPYRIKYRYKSTCKDFMDIVHWHPYYKNSPIMLATLKIELPAGYKTNIVFSSDFLYRTDTLEKTITHHWEIRKTQSIEEEIFSPHIMDLLPSVRIVPSEFTYGIKGRLDTWQQYGNWIISLNDGLDNLPQGEKNQVDKIIEGLQDKEDIVKALFHYIQDRTRYINVTIDIGGMKPYPASYVSHNKYGDCKALTIYMKALLKHAGIPSHYTVIFGNETPPNINPDFPSQQFNHVILCVPLEKDTIWLENTSNVLPYNYLSVFNQNRFALLVCQDSSKLVKTPAMNLNDVLEIRVFNFHIDEHGAGKVQISKKLKGDKFDEYRNIQHNYTERDQKLFIENSIPLLNAELSKWDFAYPDRTKTSMDIFLEMDVKNQVKNVGGSIIISPVPVYLINPAKAETRKNPVFIPYPVNRVDTLIYECSFYKKYQTVLPENTSIETTYGRYTETHSKKDGKIMICRAFQLNAGRYPSEEYTGLFDFFEMIKTHRQRSHIILNPL